ncbi:autotransporter domain-containing protein [Rhizobium rhizophilum]|uniref:Autotransporter domain-containing protein n=1 Tax=Rhizobium rhizophilum TaxID=1850373 RepID=A0ABY2R394_9HYPH|nr:autotransporter domain-containing protein [Rhizobium rhizophilum]THV17281.1 autotransporter domain-containing protein [Rhizobium rhizophilum]
MTSASILPFLGGTVQAGSVNWTGATSNDWFTDSNWEWDTGAPTRDDDARIDQMGVVINGQDADAENLFIGIVSAGGLSVQDGLNTTTTALGYNAGSSGTLTLSGDPGSWINNGATYVGADGIGVVNVETGSEYFSLDVYLGSGATGSGTLNVSNQSDFEARDNFFIGYGGTGTFILEEESKAFSGRTVIADGLNSSGSATVATDATWNITDDLIVGGAGVGTLTIREGADVSGESVFIGNGTYASGSAVTVTGAGTTWYNTGALFVGSFGDSTLEILAGAEVENGAAIIGRHSTSSVTVSGSGSTWTTGALLVGGDRSDSDPTAGNGTMEILAGATVNGTSAILGDSTLSEGTVNVDGSGSLWDLSDRVSVGGLGEGTVTITNGGKISSTGGLIGHEASGSGLVTISGNGSLWENTGVFYVGNVGDGTLQLLTGGDLTSTDGYVGTENGSDSEATVNGTGSSWIMSGDFLVGHNSGSLGSVTISAGGLIENRQGILGDLALSYGQMLVTGNGSLWDVSSDLNVGRIGEGALTIALGGDVSAARSLIGNNANSIGEATVSGNGSTWTTSGGLYVGNEGTGTLIVTGGGFVSADEITIANRAGSYGTFIIGAALGQTAGGSAGFDAEEIHFGDGTGALVFNFGGADVSFDSVIDGTGKITVANGKVLYGGDGSAFTGTTEVSGGTLHLANASLGGILSVSGWGTLSGTGTVGSTTVASGATITPGGSGVGTLTIDGNLVIDAGATYEVDVNTATGASDLLHATGTARLTGGSVLHVGPSSGYGFERSYVILTADGGLTGTFDTVASNYSFLDAALGYDANDVTLTLTRNAVDFADVAQSTNQSATAGAVEGLGSGNAIYDAVVVLDDEGAANSFQQLSGEVHGQGMSASVENSGLIRNLGSNRVRSFFGSVGAGQGNTVALGTGSTGGNSTALAYGEEKTKTAAELAAESILVTPKPAGPVAWAEAYGGWGKSFGENGDADLSNSIGGIAFGIDTAVPDTTWRLGILGGYGAASFELSDGRSSGDSDDFDIGLYGGNQWGPLALRFGALFKHQQVSTERTVDFGGFTDQLSADYGTNTVQAFAELGYEVKVEDIRLEPFVSLAQVHMHTPAFTEEGGAASLSRQASDTNLTFTNLGLRAATDWQLAGKGVTIRGGAAWQHAFGDTATASSLSFAGGSDFVTSSKIVADNSLLLQAGIDMPMGDLATVGVSFDGSYSNRGNAQTVKLNFQKQF